MHNNFHSFEAKNNFELGLIMGKKFAKDAKTAENKLLKTPGYGAEIKQAKKYLAITNKYFPQYIKELKGYARGAHVNFLNLWTLSLEDEINQNTEANRCTTIITNNGRLISHNEDWAKNSQDTISVVSKKIKEMTIFELYYFNTLGGNSISINSNGFMVATNSLIHKNRQFGVPQNVIARWLSETENPEADFKKLKNMPRSLGYSHNIVNAKGQIWNIEYTSRDAMLTKPKSPFVHTNHYLTRLKSYEANNNSTGTFNRYQTAKAKVKKLMTTSELARLTDNKSDGSVLSIMNERTIGKMLINLESAEIFVWLLREPRKKLVRYKLNRLIPRLSIPD